MTPARRQYARQAYARTADAFETAAWRAPVAQGFDQGPTNHGDRPQPTRTTIRKEFAALPAWLHIVGGGVAAALMGALLGGALHV